MATDVRAVATPAGREPVTTATIVVPHLTDRLRGR